MSTNAKPGDNAVTFPDLRTLLNSQVLVLNRLWQAVNICSARRAFSLVYAGHAQIVSSDNANNFSTHDFESWRDLSANAPELAAVCPDHLCCAPARSLEALRRSGILERRIERLAQGLTASQPSCSY